MYATLPPKTKLSGVLSKDPTRPMLTMANLREMTPGEWVLEATDSYKLARVPLTISQADIDPPLVAGMLSGAALRAVESTGAFRATKTVIEPVDRKDGKSQGVWFTRPVPGKWPDVDKLLLSGEKEGFTVGLNAEFLAQLADALAVKHLQFRSPVYLTFATDKAGVPKPLGGITVTVPHNDGVGLLMPVRIA